MIKRRISSRPRFFDLVSTVGHTPVQPAPRWPVYGGAQERHPACLTPLLSAIGYTNYSLPRAQQGLFLSLQRPLKRAEKSTDIRTSWLCRGLGRQLCVLHLPEVWKGFFGNPPAPRAPRRTGIPPLPTVQGFDRSRQRRPEGRRIGQPGMVVHGPGRTEPQADAPARPWCSPM